MEQNKSWSGNAFTQSTFFEVDVIEPFFSRLGSSKITIFDIFLWKIKRIIR